MLPVALDTPKKRQALGWGLPHLCTRSKTRPLGQRPPPFSPDSSLTVQGEHSNICSGHAVELAKIFIVIHPFVSARSLEREGELGGV